MTRDALDEARRRWGDAVAAVFEFPAAPDDAAWPCDFGDVLELEPSEFYVVVLPELSGEHLLALELDAEWRVVRDEDALPEKLVCHWESAGQRVGRIADLDEDTRREIDPYRRGVLLNDLHWDEGIEFLEAREREDLQEGRWDELSTGARSMAEEIFGSLAETGSEPGHRVLWHTEDDWATWCWMGPVTEAEVEGVLAEVLRTHTPPRAIRRGVYRSGPDNVNKIEIWRHTTKLAEHRLLRGQGEAD